MSYTRRQYLLATGAALLGGSGAGAQTPAPSTRGSASADSPWYTRCYRWAQVNTTQKDFTQYDLTWWREQWKRTAVQALFVNALGAEFAQYPSKNPLLQRNLFLPDRDLFGEIVAAAHQDGIVVMARMDNSNIGGDAFRQAHSDWYTVDRNGNRGNAPCINSPYRSEFMPDVYREILTRYKPEGFMDNSGLGGTICYCRFCTKLYGDAFGKPLPTAADWHNPDYRQWVRWMEDRYLAIWDLNNRVATEAGGPDCRYVGLVRKFQANVRNISRHTPILMMDSQSRNDEGSFRENADEARYLNGLGGWNKIVIEAEAMYHHSHGYFRLASDPPAEARMYMWSGLAGGFQPYYHYLGAYWEDTRGYQTPTPVMLWHRKNEQYLVKRRPVATVAVLRSDESSVFYGRDATAQLVQTPYRGMVRAIFPTRIPYIPIQIDDLPLYADQLSVLILPNIGGMSDANCAAIRRFVEAGGALIATGVTSLYDGDGEPRADFGLASVFGAHVQGALPDRTIAPGTSASYLQLAGNGQSRHPVLSGFENTDLIAFGGALTPLRVDSDRTVLCTYVPPGNLDSPQDARPDTPGLIVGSFGKGKVAFLPADLDRRGMIEPLPDHEKLIGNLLRWALGDNIPVTVDGPGYIGVYLYSQPNRLVLHLINGTGVDNGELITDKYYPVGPLKIKVKIPQDMKPANLKFEVSERSLS
ncbi:MAG TPA: alpha-amylase family protein, partial [Bryobacteraceae bacterium]